jgi:nucleotide-binding universal stress UspA family protein
VEEVKRILVVSGMMMFSRKAIRYGIAISNKYGSELFVIHVVHDPVSFDGWFPVSTKESLQKRKKKAKEEIDKIISAEKEGGKHIEEIMVEGNPFNEIVKAVEKEKIDLIILPTHEEGRIEHYLFSHINDKIIKAMPCSVLLVKSEPEFI